MASAVATMPSSISSRSTEHRRSESEALPRGFTAVNITPPHSRGTHEPRRSSDETNGGPESSATSPDVSPRHSTASAGRHGNSSALYLNGYQNAQSKRRRSMSSEQAMQSPRRYDYHPPRKPESEQQHMADRALHVLDTTNQHPSNSYYSTTPHGPDRSGYAYERPYSGPNGSNSVHASTPEGRLAEAFSRDNSEHHYASSANGMDQDRGDEGKEMSQNHSGQKRKRNFSNRTKTGCITCRQRKKKCDEGRPTCNNCNRGGFECHGYSTSRPSSWPKPVPVKQPVALQSKENDELNSYHESATPVSTHPSNTESSRPRPHGAGDGHDQPRPQYLPNASNPADSRPPYPGQQQHQPQWAQHAHHPQHPPSHGTSPQASYPPDHLPPLSTLRQPEDHQQQQQHHLQHHQKHDYTSTPQRDMSRPAPQAQAPGPPPSAAPGPAPWHQHTSQHSSQQPQSQPQSQTQSQTQSQSQSQPPPQQSQHQTAAPQYPPPVTQQQEYGARPAPYPPRIDTTQPQYTAGTASSARLNTAYTANTASASYSSHEQKQNKLFSSEDVERSKMCRNVPYNYFDSTLLGERQRCSAALLRFNNACQLGSGISEGELQSMLMKVFDPQLDKTHANHAQIPKKGSVGPGVRIEPGFRCTYGYNIRIYDNVFIGENTRIDDSAQVDIGARSWIGANVTILTNDVAKDMVQRKGTDGQSCTARAVIIQSEVVIGTGAVIYPGVKLGRGSTVEPFAVVKHDLGDYVTQKVPAGPQMGGAMMG